MDDNFGFTLSGKDESGMPNKTDSTCRVTKISRNGIACFNRFLLFDIQELLAMKLSSSPVDMDPFKYQ